MSSIGTKTGSSRIAAERAHVGTLVQRDVVPLDITVLAGGPGVEREVSLQSGRAVYDALLRLGHGATLCDIGPGDHEALDRPADFVFVALHGEFGEDGTVQRLLDDRGLVYSGCGAAASRLVMNNRYLLTGRTAQESSILMVRRFFPVCTTCMSIRSWLDSSKFPA